MSIEITPVRGRRDLARFIALPHDLHRGDPNYVPQLDLQQRGLLGAGSPFREHGEMELFLARRDGRVAGRIAAVGNGLHDAHHGGRQGFFGFFACADDEALAAGLLGACRTWLAARGRTGLRGPVNPDLNTSAGLLVAGCDRPPAVFMPYNGPHAARLLEAAGLVVVKRLNAWDIPAAGIPERAWRYAARVERRLRARGYAVRPLDRSDFAAELARLRPVYNAALEGTWGHTPLTEAEFRDQARGLRLICPPEFIQVAELDGRTVGFVGAAPDLNQVLRRIPRGRLLPGGWWRLLADRRRIDWARIVMYGVEPRHRGTGLAVWLYMAVTRAIVARGYRGAEASYVLEDNRPVNGLARRLGGVCARRYAIYDLPGGAEVGP